MGMRAGEGGIYSRLCPWDQLICPLKTKVRLRIDNRRGRPFCQGKYNGNTPMKYSVAVWGIEKFEFLPTFFEHGYLA